MIYNHQLHWGGAEIDGAMLLTTLAGLTAPVAQTILTTLAILIKFHHI